MHLIQIVTISLAVWLGFCIIHGSAIKCYHCHSHRNGECKDPFAPYNVSSILVDCDSLKDGNNYTFCRKTVQYASLGAERETSRVIRACAHLQDTRLEPDEGDDPSQLKCYRRTGTFGVDLLYCGCYTDGCNAASVPVAGLTVTVLSLAAAFLSAKY